MQFTKYVQDLLKHEKILLAHIQEKGTLFFFLNAFTHVDPLSWISKADGQWPMSPKQRWHKLAIKCDPQHYYNHKHMQTCQEVSMDSPDLSITQISDLIDIFSYS